MSKKPKLSTEAQERIMKLSDEDIRALSQLPTLETNSAEFGELFRLNPGAVLAAKGLQVSPAEIKRIKEEVASLQRRVPELDAMRDLVDVAIDIVIQ